jgi:hypothetical protein
MDETLIPNGKSKQLKYVSHYFVLFGYLPAKAFFL